MFASTWTDLENGGLAYGGQVLPIPTPLESTTIQTSHGGGGFSMELETQKKIQPILGKYFNLFLPYLEGDITHCAK